MFNKLHMKLTIFNTIILVLFLCVFSSVIYLYMNRMIEKAANPVLMNAAMKVDSLYEIPEQKKPFIKEKGLLIPSRNKKPDELNYVFRDKELKITAISDYDETIIEQTISYAQESLKDNEPKWHTVKINGQLTRLHSVPFNKNNQSGVIQVYRSIEFERHFLSQLITILIILGLVGIIIMTFIGWILAKQSLVPIKDSWQKQKDFVSDASHELRTPLTIIQTNLEVALSNPDETISQNKQWLNNAHSESKSMGKLIENLLLIAQVDSNQVQVNSEVFNLSELAEEVFNRMNTIFEKENLQVESVIEKSLSFKGDKLKIKQLLFIIFDNAIRYTPSGGKIIFELRSKGKGVEIVVKDTGIGINEEDLERIFDRFYRADKMRSREDGGTGLGLSIANFIVKIHNGSIKVTSQVNKGSTFIIEMSGL